MKISIVLLVAATILAAGFTAHADKTINENGTPDGNESLSSYHDNLNVPRAQGHFTCPPADNVGGEHFYGNVIFIPRERGNSAITILMQSGNKDSQKSFGHVNAGRD